MSKKIHDAIQSEIDETGSFRRGRVAECDLHICLESASTLDQPISYVANTSKPDYTVTIGQGK